MRKVKIRYMLFTCLFFTLYTSAQDRIINQKQNYPITGDQKTKWGGDYRDIPPIIHYYAYYNADYFEIVQYADEMHKLYISFQGSAYSENGANEVMGATCDDNKDGIYNEWCHEQYVFLKFDYRVNGGTKQTLKEWRHDILEHLYYEQFIYLNVKNNYKDVYKYEYENKTGATKTIQIIFDIRAHTCPTSDNTANMVCQSDPPWESEIFTVPSKPPTISSTKYIVNFQSGSSSGAPQIISNAFKIENTGSGTLTFESATNRNWITYLPTGQKNAPQSFNVTVNRLQIQRAELKKKTHFGDISFTSNGGDTLVSIKADLAKPIAPTLVISNAGHYNECPHLVWNSVNLVYKYYIYRDPYYAPSYWELIDSTETTSYTDSDVVMTSQAQADDKFYYKVEAWNGAGGTYSNTTSTWGFTMNEASPQEQQILQNELPDSYTLDECYPNPGNPGTTIRFGLPHDGQVVLQVLNIKGELVRSLIDGEQPAGFHEVFWDGHNDEGTTVVTGMYIFVMKAGGEVLNKKFSLIK